MKILHRENISQLSTDLLRYCNKEVSHKCSRELQKNCEKSFKPVTFLERETFS